MYQRIAVKDSGHTPLPILAIHGSASNGGFWKPLRAHLHDGILVLSPNLKGYGKYDSKVADSSSTLSLRAQPLVDMILSLDTRFHLVAHSFGASVALEIARVIPNRIGSMSFYEPVIPALLRESGHARDLALLGDLIALSDILGGTSGEVGIESFINFWSEQGTWEKLNQASRTKLAQLAPIVYQDFIEAYLNLSPDNFRNTDVPAPLRIYMGEHANEHARRMSTILYKRFTDTSIQTLKGMGHMGPLTHADDFFPNLVEHITRLEAMRAAKPENNPRPESKYLLGATLSTTQS